MNPLFLIPIIIVLPFMTAAALLVPTHLALTAACYLIYMQSGNEAPILAHIADPPYMLESYMRLLNHWLAHMEELSILTYATPLLALPTIIIGLSAWLTYRFLSGIKNFLSNV